MTVSPTALGWALDFEPLLDAAVGRRPYYSNETEAELLVQLGPHVTVTMGVKVCAHVAGKVVVPCTPVSPTVDGRATVLIFSIASLPAKVNSTIVISFTAADRLGRGGGGPLSGTIVRRFARVPPPKDDGSDGVSVVVDHRHRALRVNGELFLGRGFYWPSTQRMSLDQERQWMFYLSQQGVNQLELGLDQRSPANATAVLAMADSFGIKVMFSAVKTVDDAMNCTATGCDSEQTIKQRVESGKLFELVDAHKSSPALLSWYICDDCPCGGDAASDSKRHALSYVYSLLKQRDPYHITSGAGGCGNMYSLGEPYALSLDQIMYENYTPTPSSHFGGGTWPTGKGSR